MNLNLCKCLNCDNILIDMNPQTDAKEYDEKSDEAIKATDMVQVEKNGEVYWACPKCMTDEYLSDEVVLDK